jgi:predicted nucleic acid-binding Zn ribbon protein
MPGEVPDDGSRARRAREALAKAKADARARGNRPAAPGGAQSPSGAQSPASHGLPEQHPPGETPAPKPRTPVAGGPAPRRRRPRRDDPERLGAAIEGLIDSQGWHEPAAAGSLFGRWAEIVGHDLALHTRPDSLADGELTVSADSTAWATQLRLLAPQLVRRLNAELGNGVVRHVRVRGPASAAGPSRGGGQWRVRGSRGPRDTYG